ncbi:cobyrinic acid a,c-diamide synthase [Saccharomonospora xinjiangensis]|uniref:cobyrinic acid a,c-diamide synthase n=1 Tax=Saccharomonospora xinjiangensis TaxID=75294 RepID=UPI0035104204
MSRRAPLPGASELFRRTAQRDIDASRQPQATAHEDAPRRPARTEDRSAPRRGSGRQKHDAKITVYVSGDELLAMEHARLKLRGSHDLAVDRGRIVREAVAVVLADFELRGDDSVLVRRLKDEDIDEDRLLDDSAPGEDATSR